MEGPSVTNSISAALEHTQRILFQPFRLKFWLKLGVIISFISGGQASFNLGDDFGGFNPNSASPSDFDFLNPIISPIENIYDQNQLLFALLILIFVAVVLIFWLTFSYFASVGRFMFVEALLQEDIKLRVQELLDKDSTEEEIILEVEKLIRSFDPCFSCATHFLEVNWH